MIYCYTCFIVDAYRKCFDIIAAELDGNSIYRLGIKLNLSNNVIDEIYDRSRSNYEIIHKILTKWREHAGQHADPNDLITVLQDMDKNTIADKVIAKCDSLK